MILLSGYRAGNAWTDPKTGLLTPAASAWLATLVAALQALQVQAASAGSARASAPEAAPGVHTAPPLSSIPFIM